MRVMAWNIGWNSSAASIEQKAAAVSALEADVAFFTEWSPLPTRINSAGRTRNNECHVIGDYLAASGFAHQQRDHVVDRGGEDTPWRQNFWGTLGVSREPIERLEAMPLFDHAGSWLELHHDPTGLTIVGVRQFAWDGRETPLRRQHWEWMVKQFDRLADRPTIVIGDFNTEMTYASDRKRELFGGDLLRSLTRERGWRDPHDVLGTPKRPTYWMSKAGDGKRLDYAFVSPGFGGRVVSVDTPVSLAGVQISGPARDANGERTNRVTDHAPIVLEVELR